MRKPLEKHIEYFVRYPSELSQDEKEWVKQWIEKDEELAFLADWYQEFYASVDQIDKNKKRANSTPSVIVLKPFEKRTNQPKGFVLAAQTAISNRKESTLKTVNTFVSEKHKTLIRILHDDGERRSKAYVISEFLDEDDIVLIEASDEHTVLVSQPGGTFVIPDHKISEREIADWSQCKLHLPVSRVRIYKDQDRGGINFDTSEMNRETQQVNFDIGVDALTITFDVEKKPLPVQAVLRSNETSTFWMVENGKCSIPLEQFRDSESLLYFFN